MGYRNMLMGAKKYSRAKELFGEYLKKSPGDSEVHGLLQKVNGACHPPVLR